MRLRIGFDRGTLLLEGPPRHECLSDLPGVRWDHRVACHRAPATFYTRIIARLHALGVPFDDDVLALHAGCSIASVPDLRPYQAAAIDAWTLAGRRGIVVLPTGSGKTHVAMSAIAALGASTLCLVPTRILLDQWQRALRRWLGIEIGCYGDGLRVAGPVTVATFESAWRHMHELGNRYELLVVDEAHHFGSGARDEVLEMSTAAYRLGLTATPQQGRAAANLVDLIGPLVFELGIADLAGTFLADFELVDLHLDLTREEREAYEAARRTFLTAHRHYRELAPGASWNDFLRWAARTPQGRAAVRAWHEARSVLSLTRAKREVLGSLLRRHRDSRVLVFTAGKEAAYRIAREHLIMPITADIGRRERDEMMTAFREGRIRALVSARVLNEGFDVPSAEVGIIVGGALGEREHVQRVGRLLRPAEGKRAVVYELVTRDTVEVPQARRRKRGLLRARQV